MLLFGITLMLTRLKENHSNFLHGVFRIKRRSSRSKRVCAFCGAVQLFDVDLCRLADCCSTQRPCTDIGRYVNIYIYMCVCVCVCNMNWWIYTWILERERVFVCMVNVVCFRTPNVCIYIYICIYTYIYTYIHIYMLAGGCKAEF